MMLQSRGWFRLQTSLKTALLLENLLPSSGPFWLLGGNVSSSTHGLMPFPRARDDRDRDTQRGREREGNSPRQIHIQGKRITPDHPYQEAESLEGCLKRLSTTIFKLENYDNKLVLNITQSKSHLKTGSQCLPLHIFFLFASLLPIYPRV